MIGRILAVIGVAALVYFFYLRWDRIRTADRLRREINELE